MVETAIKPALYKHKKCQKVNHNNLKVLNYPHLPEIGVPGISCDEYLSQHTDHDSVFEVKALNKFNWIRTSIVISILQYLYSEWLFWQNFCIVINPSCLSLTWVWRTKKDGSVLILHQCENDCTTRFRPQAPKLEPSRTAEWQNQGKYCWVAFLWMITPLDLIHWTMSRYEILL